MFHRPLGALKCDAHDPPGDRLAADPPLASAHSCGQEVSSPSLSTDPPLDPFDSELPTTTMTGAVSSANSYSIYICRNPALGWRVIDAGATTPASVAWKVCHVSPPETASLPVVGATNPTESRLSA